MYKSLNTYIYIVLTLLIISVTAEQLFAQSSVRNRKARMGLEVSGLQGFTNSGSMNQFESPTAMVSFFYQHFITDNLSGIGQLGIGQLSDLNGKRFMAPIDYRLQYGFGNSRSGFFRRLHLFGGIGATFFNPIETRRAENLPLSDENVARSKLFGFQSGISVTAPAGVGIKLAENRDSEVSLNLTYNYNVADLVESADQKFPGSYVGASLRFGFNKGQKSSVGAGAIKNKKDIPTPPPYSDEIYDYSGNKKPEKIVYESEKVLSLPPEPVEESESVFSDNAIYGDFQRKELDTCQKRLFLGTFSTFTEALDMAERAQEYIELPFNVAIDREKDLLKVISEPLNKYELDYFYSLESETLDNQVKVQRYCNVYPETIKYRVQIGAFLNPHNASKYAKSSSKKLEKKTEIKKYRDDPYYRVQLTARDDWRTAFREKDSVQRFKEFRDAYVSTDPRILDLDGSNGYLLQFGTFFNKQAADNLAKEVSRTFGLQTQIKYSDVENSYRVVSTMFHNWQIIHQLRDMVRWDRNFPDPMILIVNFQNINQPL